VTFKGDIPPLTKRNTAQGKPTISMSLYEDFMRHGSTVIFIQNYLNRFRIYFCWRSPERKSWERETYFDPLLFLFMTMSLKVS